MHGRRGGWGRHGKPGALPAVVWTRITHLRRSPVRHGFSYRSASWLIDIDAPPTLPPTMRTLAVFRPDDHFPEPATPAQTLRDRLNTHLRSVGVEPPRGRVVALLSPRVAGYVFNPLSVFWCHDPDDTLACVVAEVHNTYGERHCYVVSPDEHGNAQVTKAFYVSPFNPVDGTYRLHVPPPRDNGCIDVSVTLHRTDEAPFTATLSGQARPATPRRILATQLVAPFAPLVVAARIRRHGIHLWLRRLPIRPRPTRTATPSPQGAR
ncbi:DUF1365 domain-containing protein [Gordonia rhizosphera]|uniref:DUF1365 domain-containing protein n=1 Tax=Gordonia rhizosphera TaxID=83341 RepID=UPI00068E568E|nr:DUF1365 domain-containing protein [Gordonia rhizosphera]